MCLGWSTNKAQQDIDDQRKELEREQARRVKRDPQAYLPLPEQQYTPAAQPGSPQYRPTQRRSTPALAGPMIALVAIGIVISLIIGATMLLNSDPFDGYEYDDGHYFEFGNEYDLEMIEPGDSISFGSQEWQVLEHQDEQALLLCNATFAMDNEVTQEVRLVQLNAPEYLDDDYVQLGYILFSQEEYNRILMVEDTDSGEYYYIFLLTDEELEAYGLPPAEREDDDTIVHVRAAVWVNTGNDVYAETEEDDN